MCVGDPKQLPPTMFFSKLVNEDDQDEDTVTLEKPCAINENKGEYYYPVKTKKSRKIYEKYKKKSANLEKVTFIGRTGLFRYIDMAPAVNIHIKIANDFIRKNCV